jgi:hypothetical protein
MTAGFVADNAHAGPIESAMDTFRRRERARMQQDFEVVEEESSAVSSRVRLRKSGDRRRLLT